jgi:hypothetical protein
MCYGSGGSDFYFFSGNSMAYAKNSGFTTLIPFSMHVDAGVVAISDPAMLTPASGVLASNVAAVKFDFTTPGSENQYCGYGGIQIFGTANIPPAVPVLIGAGVDAGNNLVMNLGGLVAGRLYEVQSCTNLVSPITWNVETNFTAATVLASITNAVTVAAQKFYRVVGN